MWYDCQLDNSQQKTKLTQILTNIGHRMAFNNAQSPSSLVSYERSRNDNVKQFKRENKRFIYVKKMNEKQICNT